tara:strand:+ start:141 stop:566 length:426 start_codon:yes stop_codon:yes gene_type:complete
VNTGKAAEYLAASVIQSQEAERWEVVYAGVHRIDLVAFSGAHVVRVQVKSTVAPRRANKKAKIKYEFLVGSAVGGGRRNHSRRLLTSDECDVVALVALDKRLCRFMPVEVCTRIHWRFSVDEFTVETQEQTLREAFAKYER